METELTTTVTDLQNNGKLKFLYGTFNIIDCGVRTGKTYWAVNNLIKFTRDGNLNRILYLVDTKSLKNSILTQYPDLCTDADEWWLLRSNWGEQPEKIGVMCYQKIGSKAIKDELKFLEEIDCICWDECDSIFDFAIEAFAKARKTDFARKTVSSEEILAVIEKYSSKREYMPLIFLGEWERIVNEGRIMCIGLSATPERMKQYYFSLTSCANEGKLQVSYRQDKDIFFYNLREYISKLTPEPGRGYWCYSPWITENRTIVDLANNLGFHAIELHSDENKEYPLTPEQRRVSNLVLAVGRVPAEYDFVIVNKAYERGYNIEDERFTKLIVNSIDKIVQEQAARFTHNYRRALKAYAPPIPEDYLNKWLNMDECRMLAATLSVPDMESARQKNSRIMSWNKLKDNLDAFGYKCEGKKRRVKGKLQQYYYITGSWKDTEVEDKVFLELVEAKNGKLEE